MKRVKAKFLVDDAFTKESLPVLEIEEYTEDKIQKDVDILEEHSVDALIDAVLDMANGAWRFIKGLGIVLMWAGIMIVTGVRMLWKWGFGSDEVKKKEKENKKRRVGRVENITINVK